MEFLSEIRWLPLFFEYFLKVNSDLIPGNTACLPAAKKDGSREASYLVALLHRPALPAYPFGCYKWMGNQAASFLAQTPII